MIASRELDHILRPLALRTNCIPMRQDDHYRLVAQVMVVCSVTAIGSLRLVSSGPDTYDLWNDNS